MNKAAIPPLEEQIANMKQKEDKEIDFSDIPEILDWTGVARGKFFRPLKRHVTLRLDADVLEWFKRNHSKYQTAINSALRNYIHAQN
ncbi:MAG: BrnA antitoxin family protein [Desulfovibrionaceae bacterium]|nr:BrnA antitoxin family protein [Desulfovibrionaceae bacterium]